MAILIEQLNDACKPKAHGFLQANRQFQINSGGGIQVPTLSDAGWEAFWQLNPECRPPVVTVTPGTTSAPWKTLLDQFIQMNAPTHPEYAAPASPGSPYLAIRPEGYRAFLATYPQYANDPWLQSQALTAQYSPSYNDTPQYYPQGSIMPAPVSDDTWWKYGAVAAVAVFFGYLISRSSAPTRST